MYLRTLIEFCKEKMHWVSYHCHFADKVSFISTPSYSKVETIFKETYKEKNKIKIIKKLKGFNSKYIFF